MPGTIYKLLYIDDELAIKPHLAYLFEEHGFEVTKAISGQEAYDLLTSGRCFDAVLLDNMMPPGSDDDSEWPRQQTFNGFRTGYVLLEKLQKIEDESPGTFPPIWILTALPDNSVERRALEMSIVQDYVYKTVGPGKHAEVAKAIINYLDNGRLGD